MARELKQGKRPDGRSYEYDRQRVRRYLAETREWVREYYGDHCQDCGEVEPDWHLPKDNGMQEGLTLYHRTLDYWRHVAFINEHTPTGPKKDDQVWGVNLYRWLRARWNNGTDFRPSFILICRECKRLRGAG